MPTVLKIGYQEFLVRKAADAAAVVRAMAEAMPLGSRYRNGRVLYFPDESDRHGREISLCNIAASQFLARDPGEEGEMEIAAEVRVEPARKQINGSRTQRLLKY